MLRLRRFRGTRADVKTDDHAGDCVRGDDS